MSVKENERSDAQAVPSKRSFFTLPAVRALLLQAGSFVLLIILQASLLTANAGFPPVAIPLLQGMLAALLTKWVGLATWWIAIQFFFPVLLALGLLLQLPPTLFLVAFLGLLFLYWTTFRTQVPYYPSRVAVWNAIAQLLPVNRTIRFVDIGSGLGGLTLNLAGRFPDAHFEGVEIAPLPWLVSDVRAKLSKTTAIFRRVDYNRLDLSDYDVVFAYLSPAAMPALWSKARTEMRAGTRLLSYEFPIPDVEPSTIISPEGVDAKLYVFQM